MWQIIENAGVVPLLKSSLQHGRLPNAYLLVGPAHVGKMTLAINLAQALNCTAATTAAEKPCGECPSCAKIALGKHSDVQVAGLNSGKESRVKEISIEQIRDIQHSAALPPFEGKYKVYIIDGAEQLSNEASNCLLKTLEEPAENVIYLLLTASEQSILPTVVSRCQRLELKPLPPEAIEKDLVKKKNIEPVKAKLLSRLSRGCPGWAITAVDDEAILGERSERLEHILEVMHSGFEGRFTYASQLSMQFAQSRKTVIDELTLWLDWWHDLLLIKTGSGEHITGIDREADITTMAEGYNIKQIRIFISRIQEATAQLQINANPRLVLEVLMLNIPGRNT